MLDIFDNPRHWVEVEKVNTFSHGQKWLLALRGFGCGFVTNECAV